MSSCSTSWGSPGLLRIFSVRRSSACDPALGSHLRLHRLRQRAPQVVGAGPHVGLARHGPEEREPVAVERRPHPAAAGDAEARVGEPDPRDEERASDPDGRQGLREPRPGERPADEHDRRAEPLQPHARPLELLAQRLIARGGGIEHGLVERQAFRPGEVLQPCGEVERHAVVVVGAADLAQRDADARRAAGDAPPPPPCPPRRP